MELRYKYIALDQHSNHVLIKLHPYMELDEHVGGTNVRKMYHEDSEDNNFHIGYIVGPHWFDVWGLRE